MAQRCPQGQYLDMLVQKCMSCSMVCHKPVILTRCSEYCVTWRCKAVSGQFYDTLLKKCFKCSELCGSHPSACSEACKNAAAVTQRPIGVSAVQLFTTRGRSVSRAELYSEALLYSLLGMCIVVLMCTLTAAIMVLLKRAKGHQQQEDTKNQQPNKHGQSSKDSLMARAEDVSQEGSVIQDRPKATETCVYCFSDHTMAPHVLYQQADQRQDNNHHENGLVNHTVNANYDKTRSFRIICSPTQTSM
ncbi:tumor necrosis factor receptor superfamily member 13B [Myxocyprinus asiaticus]|uniref:tumor necrosis factor receptor superfamily member 13B n=1 Tax=Myxocyprinus asiaticus TaxID=70543 RepID=UPI0022238DED|nr:tumor necrosis factor receptor superfamily member 13B [Myxocyprinus asiaticus]XP_051523270.1 tumor necrosis factor receptor superfamily member 13B [Myxocyprinus asiaticus]XP_051523271.1 tumor necrosis factor receptor superfamily member 13B [Myxocyprinus asiaticus]